MLNVINFIRVKFERVCKRRFCENLQFLSFLSSHFLIKTLKQRHRKWCAIRLLSNCLVLFCSNATEIIGIKYNILRHLI